MVNKHLGVALAEQALRVDDTKGDELLAQAVLAYRSALSVYKPNEFPRDWASTQNRLGNALLEQGIRAKGANNTNLCAQAVVARLSQCITNFNVWSTAARLGCYAVQSWFCALRAGGTD